MASREKNTFARFYLLPGLNEIYAHKTLLHLDYDFAAPPMPDSLLHRTEEVTVAKKDLRPPHEWWNEHRPVPMPEKEQMLYKAAEFDNYRKRTIKEKAELLLNGAEKTVVAVLPVLDDMERAIAEGKKTDDPEVIREGMELIFQKFIKVLEGLGVKAIDTTDKDFDVDMHEAIAMVPGMGDDKKGKVIDCVQTGYTLNDKVIRHAKVAVGQ